MSEAMHMRTYWRYVTGFIGSIVCTVVAFVIVDRHLLALWPSVFVISAVSLGQFVLQLIMFLHLGEELRPRWRLATLSLMILVVVILVGGSIWIMYNLNYRMTNYPTAQQINTYITNQDGGL